MEATIDWSKVKMKTNYYPRPMSPVKTLKFDMHRYEPNPMVRGTRDMRGKIIQIFHAKTFKILNLQIFMKQLRVVALQILH